jgi:predicted AAA+ superfamily ATPase
VFRTLRVLADRPRRPASFLVLGSASESLLRQSAESLAGRIAFHDLGPLALDEVGPRSLDSLWLRGGFPLSFLAPDDAESMRWRRDFVRTFVQRDLPQLGVTIPAATIARFWSMLAHVHGQIWNGSRLASAFGVAHTTVRRWLDLLSATFVVRLLPPWHQNLAKRQVKSPRVYVADSGLVHALHDIADMDALEAHPIVGTTWESLGIDTVVRRLGARRDQCYFWATHQGAELDLLVVAGRRRLGFEFKRTSAPTVTPSMRIALADLRLERIDVIHAGTLEFEMADRIRGVPMSKVLARVPPLSGRQA